MFLCQTFFCWKLKNKQFSWTIPKIHRAWITTLGNTKYHQSRQHTPSLWWKPNNTNHNNKNHHFGEHQTVTIDITSHTNKNHHSDKHQTPTNHKNKNRYPVEHQRVMIDITNHNNINHFSDENQRVTIYITNHNNTNHRIVVRLVILSITLLSHPNVTCSRDDKIVHIALNANHLLTHYMNWIISFIRVYTVSCF